MTSLIPVGQEWNDIKNIGRVIAMGGLIQSLKGDDQQKTAAAVSLMLMGRELGIGPMESLTKIQIILGKPTIPPEMMKARVHKILPTAIFRLKHSDDKKCIYEAARPGDPVKEYSYTIENAERMGLLGKDNWKKQPDVMLQWRCCSKVSRTVFPDCISGFSYTPEELGASVNEDGEVEIVTDTTTATTIAQINAEGAAENDAKKKDELWKNCQSVMLELVGIGFKREEILKSLKLEAWADLNKESVEGLESALDVLTMLKNR